MSITTEEYVTVAKELALLRDLAVHRREAAWLALCSGPGRADGGRRLVTGLTGKELWYPRLMADLEDVLHRLHDSEINAGVQTFYDAGMKVWIGDESNGIQSETTINRTGPGFAAPRKWPEGVTAATWLHETALRLYPDSKYAKEHAG